MKDKKIQKEYETLKRYLISSLVTFSSTFLLVIGSQLGNLPEAEWGKTALFSVLITGIRAGIKAVVEKINDRI